MTAGGKGKPETVDIEVGLRIRARRLLLGKTQTELAEAIGVTFQQVQKYENGANRVAPSRLTIIAKVLDVEVSHFFGELNTAAGARIETELLSVHGAAALLRAYAAIASKNVRQHVVALVESSWAMSDATDEIARLAESISPMLRGHDPMVISAALAELTAMLLAGLRADTAAETDKLRRGILEHHVELVRDLISPHVHRIDEQVARGEITPDDIRVY